MLGEEEEEEEEEPKPGLRVSSAAITMELHRVLDLGDP